MRIMGSLLITTLGTILMKKRRKRAKMKQNNSNKKRPPHKNNNSHQHKNTIYLNRKRHPRNNKKKPKRRMRPKSSCKSFRRSTIQILNCDRLSGQMPPHSPWKRNTRYSTLICRVGECKVCWRTMAQRVRVSNKSMKKTPWRLKRNSS